MNSLLSLWSHGPDTIHCHLRRSDLETLGKRIRACSDSTLCDFQRLCRHAGDVELWIAKDFRMFLLHVGIVCLRYLLYDGVHEHFLLLSMSI